MQRKSQINYMKFAIFGNTYQAKKSFYAEQLFNLLGRYSAQISVCREFHHFLTADLGLNLPPVQLFDGDDFEADMVISLGGDGTFLKAASRVGKKSIPILGINIGRLGFLADISPEEMESTFEEIHQLIGVIGHSQLQHVYFSRMSVGRSLYDLHFLQVDIYFVVVFSAWI